MPTAISAIRAARRPILTLLVALALVACQSDPLLTPLPADARILAFGDSVTLGSGSSPGHSYPEQLAALSAHPVINAGLAGELSRDAVKRLPKVLDETHPDLLVLIHGGNDILRRIDPAQTRRNLATLLTIAQARHIPVVMLSVPKLGVVLSQADFYQDLAREYKVPIDTQVLTQIYAHEQYKSSVIHPNDAGYRLIAQAINTLLHEHGAL